MLFNIAGLRDSLDRVDDEIKVTFLGAEETISPVSKKEQEKRPQNKSQKTQQAYLLIMMVNRFTLSVSNDLVSFCSLPRYVAFIACHGTNTPIPLLESKSYSKLIDDCSRPSAKGGKSSSLSVSVYFLPSSSPISRKMPSYADKSQARVSPVVRWLANPAPPSAFASRVPWKRAEEPLMLR